MPDFWQFPTVSLGIGAITSIYQARFMKYLEARGMADTDGRKVWAFLGDGEMDEPETMGAIGLAGRERLDNLIWVVNCNLQRLDGPVRGNGKIIQELESDFRGAGWNVIKVIWGSRWDPLLAADTDGRLVRVMEESVDGDYQTYKSRDGAYVREHFFGRTRCCSSASRTCQTTRSGCSTAAATTSRRCTPPTTRPSGTPGQPTVILAKTIKGYGMGVSGEGQMITHQAKKMTEDALLAFRDRFELPLTDEQVRAPSTTCRPTTRPRCSTCASAAPRSAARCRRAGARREPLEAPALEPFKGQLEGTGDREISTTMAFVRVLAALLRDKQIGRHIVPIVPDESRTFGMEGLFRQVGIYSPVGQLYQPEDSEQLMFYKEDQHGQILEEGITEAGSISSFIAAGTSYSAHGVQMVPFYIYYSMFGYQRVGDLVWAAGDSRTRGFMLGGTAGRTTLNGEGLQHEDGHSHVLFSVVPNVRAYDPTFGYEVAVIIQDGLRRMVAEQEDVFYYITLMNENYRHPAMPEGAAGGHPARHVPAPRGAPSAPSAARPAARVGDDPARGAGGRRAARVTTSAWRPTSGASPRSPSCAATGSRSSAGTCCTRPQTPRRAYVRERLGGRAAARCRLDRLHPRLRRPDPPVGSGPLPRARHRRLRPQRLPHARCAASSRSTATTSRSPRCKELADEGEVEPARVQEAIERYEIDPEAPMPTHRMSTGAADPVEVPDIGDFEDVPVIEILVSDGDTVAVDDPLLTLESDKATMDVPAPFAGMVRRAAASRSATRSPRATLLMTIEAGATARAAAARRRAARARPAGGGRRCVRGARRAEAAAPEPAPSPSRDQARGACRRPPPPATNGARADLRQPSVRRLARELGVDLRR